MVTTKKVASRSRAQKTKSVKRKVGASRNTKKVTSAKAKKASGTLKIVQKKKRLAQENKTAPAVKRSRTAKKKKVVIHDKTSQSFDEKLKAIEAFHAKSKSKKTANITKGNKTVPAIKPQMNLALLSPFRYPLNVDQLAIQTSRYAGVFFVFVGALFTLLYAQYITGIPTSHFLSIDPGTQVATVCSAPPLDPGCESAVVNTEPPVTFKINGTEPLKGVVEVTYTVTGATKVKALAFYRSWATSVVLGEAVKVNETTWKFVWDTKKFDDGEYRLKVTVTNAHGVYEDSADDYVFVENNPPPVSDDDAVTATTTASVVEDNDGEVSDLLSVSLNRESPVSDILRFTIGVQNAESVKVFAKRPGETTERIIGYAYDRGNHEWRYNWDSTAYPNGEYTFKIVAYRPDDTLSSDPIKRTIHNDDNVVALKPVPDPVITTDTTDTDDAVVPKPSVAPIAELSIRSTQPLAKIAELRVRVEKADFIEVYARPLHSLQNKFLGLAKRLDTDRWSLYFDTTQLPNGSYNLFARVKNAYGLYESALVPAQIQNIVAVSVASNQPVNTTALSEVFSESQRNTVNTIVSEEVVTDETSIAGVANAIFVQFEKELHDELQRLATALRAQDDLAVTRIRERLQALQLKMLGTSYNAEIADALKEIIDTRVNASILRVESDVKKTESLISARAELGLVRDTDGDGVTDYDEVNLYSTDPNLPDTDGDGFTDGAEILNGYDPLDPTPEVLVRYESPKTSGIIRDDIFSVDSIVGVTDNTERLVDGVAAEALILGKGLANSFVTLYIYSTPIIVTVKTDSDGSWSYQFDKELEDGTHEIYVGVTDNSGRIVAKSNPLAFVKSAEAFTPADASVVSSAVQVGDDQSLLSNYLIYLILSISVVSIGLVLILLGMHLNSRQRRLEEIVIDDQPSL